MTEIRSAHDLREAAATAAAAVELPQPKFDFRILWALTYEALFKGETTEDTAIDALIEQALRKGRVLLQASGGAGKTSILNQLRKAKGSQDMPMVLIDLRHWQPALFEAWTELEDNEPARMELLLEALATPDGATETAIMQLPQGIPCLLMIDGLNEIPSRVGDSLLRTVDFFARRNPQAGVIVTDRLVRRPLEDPHWRLATIAPLGGESGLRGNAFFRNLFLHEGTSSTSSVAAHHEFLTRHASLSEAQLTTVAQAALQLYADTQSRTFSLVEFEQLAGAEITNRLIDAGVVIRANGGASFSHHLIHDYLASKALVADESLWMPVNFDVVTLRASSFDALAMALEQLANPEQADLFIRRTYDWNFYGAAYALATCRSRGSAAVTDHMEVALLGMLAERRWDLIRATSQQVTDALALFPSATARALLEAREFEDVIALVTEAMGQDSSWDNWLHLFARPPGSSVTDDDLLVLAQSDSLMGWTMSNVAKRTALSQDQQATLRRLLREADDPVVRWRAAHALGAHPSLENVTALFTALNDDYYWVTYGAARSLIEAAARSPEQRSFVLQQLRAEIRQRSDESAVVRQLDRSLILRDPPADWESFAGPLIEDLLASAKTQERQDRWRNVAYEVRQAQEGASRVA